MADEGWCAGSGGPLVSVDESAEDVPADDRSARAGLHRANERLLSPSPRRTRSFEQWFRLAAVRPRTTGVRVWTGTTAEPTWRRSVDRAMSVISVTPS